MQGKGLNDIMAEVEESERGAKQQEISGQWGRGNGTAWGAKMSCEIVSCHSALHPGMQFHGRLNLLI